MIPVQPQPAPVDFHALVAKPGEEFLRLCPSPSQNQWDRHAYWQKVLDHLEVAYDAICAYSAFRIHEHTGSRSVDHFTPKTDDPTKAYVWENYRFVCARSNSRRSKKKILDPFMLREGTFAIAFPSLQVICGPLCDQEPDLATDVESTREALNLDSTRLKGLRERLLREFAFGHMSLEKLHADAPFLARELVRQGLDDRVKLIDVMSFEDPYPKKPIPP